MSAAFADALSSSGGMVVVVDAVPELLGAARAHVMAAAGSGIEVCAVQADAASDELLDVVPRVDLVLASVVHHLPDQQRGINRDTVDRLLDPLSPHYLGRRDDVFLLAAETVYLGTAPD